MIDLGDQAVHVVRGGCSNEEIRAAGIVEERQRAVWRGPWIAGQQPRDYWIRWTTERGDFPWIRNPRGGVQSDTFALTFVSEIEERPVVDDWTTERAAKLIVAKLGLRIGFGVEDIARVEFVVAEEFKQRAVKIVCAGLGDDVDDRAGVAAIFSFEV